MSTMQYAFDSDSEDIDFEYMQLQIDASNAYEEYMSRRLACKRYVRDKRAAAKTAKPMKPVKPMKPRRKAKGGMRCTNEKSKQSKVCVYIMVTSIIRLTPTKYSKHTANI